MNHNFVYTKAKVLNRGIAPDSFLNELIDVVRGLPEALFAPNMNHDVYTNIVGTKKPNGEMDYLLGPWTSLLHRRAAMCEVLRVLGGFESSWNWNEGVDHANKTSESHIKGQETGLWQVSYDSLPFGHDLTECAVRFCGPAFSVQHYIDTMKSSHPFAIEYIIRLLRHTVNHNGPVKRHEIDKWLHRDAVNEFQGFLA